MDELVEAISLAPQPANAYLEVGDLYRTGKEYERANTWYWRAAETSPDNDSPWFMLGVTTYLQGKCKEAIIYLRRAISLAPTKPYAHAYLGRCLYALETPNDALAHLEFSVKRVPNNSVYLTWLADTYLVLGREQDALEDYAAALQLDPTNKYLLTKIDLITVDRVNKYNER